ncbi:MAG: hypothetical protein IPJ65_02740 [Archangiaceae bacterium]|nr:hypothetical protein [Archangiaceae bacterium]
MDDSNKPASQVFLLSDGTTEDFEEFFKKDPIGAAQYATGLAKATQQKFDGLEEMEKMLEEPNVPLETRKQRLSSLGKKSQSLFKFVETTEARIQARDDTLGWTTGGTA